MSDSAKEGMDELLIEVLNSNDVSSLKLSKEKHDGNTDEHVETHNASESVVTKSHPTYEVSLANKITKPNPLSESKKNIQLESPATAEKLAAKKRDMHNSSPASMDSFENDQSTPSIEPMGLSTLSHEQENFQNDKATKNPKIIGVLEK